MQVNDLTHIGVSGSCPNRKLILRISKQEQISNKGNISIN